MATNNFLPWGDNAGNIMDGADYEASTQRTDGVELGLADPALHNRLYRQVTLMAAALGQVIADSGLDATDSNMADLVRAIKQVFFAVVPVDKGGTGATDAAGARANLAVPEVRNRVVITANQGGIGPGIKAGEYWQFWNLQDGDEYPAGLCPSTNGRQLLGHSSYRIKEAYINNFPCGTWNGNAIAVNKGGTGASDAAAARANLGALATSGGPITGYLQFGTMSNGLEWFTADGTQIHLRPYTPGNSFQITLKGPNTDDQETGAFNISTTGYVTLGRPLGIESGGTGANSAAGARNNLSVPELRNSVVIVNNQKGIGTGVSAGQYWQLWNLQNGSTYPAGLVPSENGTQCLGQNGYRIKAVYANDYPCGTWNGNAIAVAKGGTGATDAAGARANLDITPANIGAAPTSHTHGANDIASGILPIVRGGTGASDAATARANLGALATSGGPITGYLQFGTMSNGLEWFTADGTQIHLRPYTPGNSFQITLKGPNTDDQETGAFNISTTGYVTLGRPLGIESGGTGANSAAGARNNLSVPELRNSVVIVNNQKGIGTGVSAGQYWQLWNLQNGSTYPVGLVPSENGTQYLGQNGYRIKAVYANDYPCGTWNGNPIALSKGGLGRSFASEAELKTYLQGLLGLS